MVLTAAPKTTLFEDAAHMGLYNRTRVDYIQEEGTLTITDLYDWEDEYWDQWWSICKNPDRIHDPTAGAEVGALINQVPFSVPVRSLKRLRIASRVVRYYNYGMH